MKQDASVRPWQFIYDELNIRERSPSAIPFSVHLRRHAQERPNSIAMSYLGYETSYAEFECQVNTVARLLEDMNVNKGDVVGIYLPNVPQYAAIMAGAAKRGITVCCLSPLLAPPELCHQLKDANISVLFALDLLLPVVKAISESISGVVKNAVVTGSLDTLPNAPEVGDISLAGISSWRYTELMAKYSTDAVDQVPVEADDVALIQYTGGTTGMPKGAMLTHGGLAWVAENTYVHAAPVEGEEVFSSAFPMFHIAGSSGMMALTRFGGMCAVIPDPRDLDFFLDQVIAYPPTLFGAVPSLYQMLLDHPKSKDVDFSRLKIAISGAAPLTGGERKKVDAWVGENKLADFFGMTETSPNYLCNPPSRSKPSTVGIPLPGVDVRIVDLATGESELPSGEEGEIIVATPGLMKGYLNMPEETAKALRSFNGKTYMYTGDVGFMDDEGYITICDRAKDMLNVSGYKVFSIEIENKLSHLDCIERAAVVGSPDLKRPGNDIVNLFVQLASEFERDDADSLNQRITDYCRANMAPYKVPKNIVFIAEIPMTAVGKVDKKLMRDQLA